MRSLYWRATPQEDWEWLDDEDPSNSIEYLIANYNMVLKGAGEFKVVEKEEEDGD